MGILGSQTPARARRKIVAASGDYKSVDPTAITVDTKNATWLRVNTNVTAVSGSGATVTVTVVGLDADGVTTYTIANATKAITTTGLTTFTIDPRVAASAGVNAQTPLPAQVQITAVGSGTRTTLTYAISAEVG